MRDGWQVFQAHHGHEGIAYNDTRPEVKDIPRQRLVDNAGLIDPLYPHAVAIDAFEMSHTAMEEAFEWLAEQCCGPYRTAIARVSHEDGYGFSFEQLIRFENREDAAAFRLTFA